MGCVQGYSESWGCFGLLRWKECSTGRTYLGIDSWAVTFHSTTLVLFQCTTFFPSLWLPCISIQVLILGVRHSIFLNILLRIRRLPR